MNTEYEKALGKNIRRLRMERKLSQEQAAAQLQVRGCDVTRSALAKMEVGQRHIYPDELKALREILRCTLRSPFSVKLPKRLFPDLFHKAPVRETGSKRTLPGCFPKKIVEALITGRSVAVALL